jgi:RNA polymerase sigma-70 factor (ECF subfamily)
MNGGRRAQRDQPQRAPETIELGASDRVPEVRGAGTLRAAALLECEVRGRFEPEEPRHSVSAIEQVRDADAHLVQRAREGDSDAVTELYRRHERRVYNLALRTLGNPWDAADVSQEAFIKAFRSLDSFKGESRFTTWLHRIVVNAAYDHLRRQRPEPMEIDIIDDLSGPSGSGAVVGSSRAGTDPALDGISDPLREALMSLNEGFRFAVVLCDLLGFPYSEAAEILGVQEGTIKSRIFRAREALASALVDAGYELPGVRNPDGEDGVTRQGMIGEDG